MLKNSQIIQMKSGSLVNARLIDDFIWDWMTEMFTVMTLTHQCQL